MCTTHYIKIQKDVVKTESGDYERYISRPDTHQSVSIKGFSVVGEHNEWDFVLKGELLGTYYLVWCSYNSGDSYGSDYGWCAMSALCRSAEDAATIATAIVDNYKTNKDSMKAIRVTLSDGTIEQIHVSEWKGYFDRLTDVHVEVVRNSAKGSELHFKIQ